MQLAQLPPHNQLRPLSRPNLCEAHNFSPLVLNLEPIHFAIFLLLLDAPFQVSLCGDGLLPAPTESSPGWSLI